MFSFGGGFGSGCDVEEDEQRALRSHGPFIVLSLLLAGLMNPLIPLLLSLIEELSSLAISYPSHRVFNFDSIN